MTSVAPRRILVVIDPASAQHPGLEQATRLATAGRDTIEIYVCDTAPSLPSDWIGALNEHECRALLQEQRLEALEALAQPLRERGFKVVTCSEWHAPLEEGVLRHMRQHPADLVIYSDMLMVKPGKRKIASNLGS